MYYYNHAKYDHHYTQGYFIQRCKCDFVRKCYVSKVVKVGYFTSLQIMCTQVNGKNVTFTGKIKFMLKNE